MAAGSQSLKSPTIEIRTAFAAVSTNGTGRASPRFPNDWKRTTAASAAARPVTSRRQEGTQERRGTPSSRARVRMSSLKEGRGARTWRSSATKLSSSGGKSFVIGSLPQQPAQLLEAALDAHFQRGYAHACDHRYVIVAQVLDVTQQKYLPLLDRQSAQNRSGWVAGPFPTLGASWSPRRTSTASRRRRWARRERQRLTRMR